MICWDKFHSDDYWFILPYLTFGRCPTEFNIAFGWWSWEIRVTFIKERTR